MALGPDHPSTANTLHQLASLSHAQGNYVEAEPLYRQALHIYEQSFGSDHPYTKQARKHYALLLHEMERALEAQQPEQG